MPRALAPLHHLLSGQYMQVIDQLYSMLQGESRAHADTLGVLQEIKNKQRSIDQLVISDDGWRWMPESPKSGGEAAGKSQSGGSNVKPATK